LGGETDQSIRAVHVVAHKNGQKEKEEIEQT
jgi:hypothetical protein